VAIEPVLPRKIPSVDDTVIPDYFRMVSDLCFQVMSEKVNPRSQRSGLFWAAAERTFHVEQVAIKPTLTGKICQGASVVGGDGERWGGLF
jgi:hypothetical protein